ncbi:hypothetical protein Tco_1122104 [Tanacetum coccineum]|uniref:LAGLIDADG homing endonuclease n=1 Tax=Tanacetum coccineum TaxID=301880 RepID=A0ABQ5IZS5_9ASTR
MGIWKRNTIWPIRDYPIWEVIQNGNGPVSITTDTSGQIKVLPPRTAEEINEIGWMPSYLDLVLEIDDPRRMQKYILKQTGLKDSLYQQQKGFTKL